MSNVLKMERSSYEELLFFHVFLIFCGNHTLKCLWTFDPQLRCINVIQMAVYICLVLCWCGYKTGDWNIFKFAYNVGEGTAIFARYNQMIIKKEFVRRNRTNLLYYTYLNFYFCTVQKKLFSLLSLLLLLV